MQDPLRSAISVMNTLPTTNDVETAFSVLKHVVRETPLLESPILNAATGGRILVKAESLQLAGSFKIRGAYYRVSRLSVEERNRGVIAYSSGNFAQGLAAAGAMLETTVTIVMPVDAPQRKIDATRNLGADVVLSEHGNRNREVVANALARELAVERNLTLLHPFDDPDIVAGQASVGVELLDQAADMGCVPDTLLVPVGGGGLIAGCALATQTRGEGLDVFAVEPSGYDDMCRSLDAGERVGNEANPPTLCDALQAQMPGEVTFGTFQPLSAGGVSVDDAEVTEGMRTAFADFKIVLEPSGAVALAALIAGKVETAGRCIGVVASGGNISLEDFQRITV